MNPLNKLRVLITGASYGIGEDFARIFASEKFDLVLTARSRDKLEALARELSQTYRVEVSVIDEDLADPEAPRRIFETLEREGKQIDVLVNNAGFGLHGEVSTMDRNEILSMIQLNITALTDLTRLFLPGMRARRLGKILNVASTAAFQPGPLMAVYYATKAYVLSFSEALNEEVRGTGVNVTCLCPGPTRSEFQKRAGMEDMALFTHASMPSRPVAEAGFKALMKGRPLIIPGFLNKFVAFTTRLSPRALVPRIVRALQSRRGGRH